MAVYSFSRLSELTCLHIRHLQVPCGLYSGQVSSMKWVILLMEREEICLILSSVIPMISLICLWERLRFILNMNISRASLVKQWSWAVRHQSQHFFIHSCSSLSCSAGSMAGRSRNSSIRSWWRFFHSGHSAVWYVCILCISM